ncbi:MAG: hypothetical protein NZ781_00215 [Armatimonadetes bacterium]|nr:hypothetical protein [Armatimonadota bacterium]
MTECYNCSTISYCPICLTCYFCNYIEDADANGSQEVCEQDDGAYELYEYEPYWCEPCESYNYEPIESYPPLDEQTESCPSDTEPNKGIRNKLIEQAAQQSNVATIEMLYPKRVSSNVYITSAKHKQAMSEASTQSSSDAQVVSGAHIPIVVHIAASDRDWIASRDEVVIGVGDEELARYNGVDSGWQPSFCPVYIHHVYDPKGGTRHWVIHTRWTAREYENGTYSLWAKAKGSWRRWRIGEDGQFGMDRISFAIETSCNVVLDNTPLVKGLTAYKAVYDPVSRKVREKSVGKITGNVNLKVIARPAMGVVEYTYPVYVDEEGNLRYVTVRYNNWNYLDGVEFSANGKVIKFVNQGEPLISWGDENVSDEDRHTYIYRCVFDSARKSKDDPYSPEWEDGEVEIVAKAISGLSFAQTKINAILKNEGKIYGKVVHALKMCPNGKVAEEDPEPPIKGAKVKLIELREGEDGSTYQEWKI